MESEEKNTYIRAHGLCMAGHTPLPRQGVSEDSGSHVTASLSSWNSGKLCPSLSPFPPPTLRKGQGLQM